MVAPLESVAVTVTGIVTAAPLGGETFASAIETWAITPFKVTATLFGPFAETLADTMPVESCEPVPFGPPNIVTVN